MTQANATGNGAPPRASTANHTITLGEALSCLNTAEKAVLLYLKSATLKATSVTVAASEIAQRTTFSYSAVKTALRRMEGQQLIRCLRRGKSRYEPSTWMLLVSGESRRPPRRQPKHENNNDEPNVVAPPLPTWSDAPETVDELCDRFIEWAQSYYRRDDGTSTPEWKSLRVAMIQLKTVAGERAPNTLSAEDLYAVQASMLATRNGGKSGKPYARRYINKTVQRIGQLLRWATRPPQRWLPPSIMADAQLVEPLKHGRCTARETEPIRPVEWEHVAAVLPHLNRRVKAMVLIQWASGMRPCEVCMMKPCEIEQSGEIWLYRPTRHKTMHHGMGRVIPLDMQAQRALKPFLIGRDPDAYIFSPAESIAEHLASLHKGRKTPLKYGNRPGTNVKDAPRRRPRDHYDAHSYRQSLHSGCDRAFPPPDHLRPFTLPGGKHESDKSCKARLAPEEWEELREWRARHRFNPNQLRHAAATRFRREYGIEAAQILLGHSNLRTTEIYAESSLDKLMGLMLNGNSKSNGSTR